MSRRKVRTRIEMEVLDAIARGDPPFPGKKVELAPGDHRRNLTTLDVPLNHLVGKRFKVGDAVLFGGRLNFSLQVPRDTAGAAGLYILVDEGGD
jgi:hypothetical protein